MPAKSVRRSAKCKTAHRRRKVHWKRRITGGGILTNLSNGVPTDSSKEVPTDSSKEVPTDPGATNGPQEGQDEKRAAQPTDFTVDSSTTKTPGILDMVSSMFKSKEASAPAGPSAPSVPVELSAPSVPAVNKPWYQFWGGKSRRRKRKCKGGCSTRKTRHAKKSQ